MEPHTAKNDLRYAGLPNRGSVVLQVENQYLEIVEAEIFDSTSLPGARAKARRWLRKTFCREVKRVRVDNYEYWTVVDVAEVDEWQRRRRAKQSR